jgi:hypothetical protein
MGSRSRGQDAEDRLGDERYVRPMIGKVNEDGIVQRCTVARARGWMVFRPD